MSPLAAVAARSAGLVLLLSVAAACTSGAASTMSAAPLPTPSPPPATAPITPVPEATAPVSPAATPLMPPTATATPPATQDPAATSLPRATPTPRPSPDPAGDPPLAQLAGLAGDAVDGDLGSFVWDGLVSDAPWIVGAARGTASPGAGLSVSFQPGGRVRAWRARWARVSGGEAGTPSAAGAGTSGRILLTAPRAVGTWSLQLTTDFGAGRSATWYWRVKVRR